MFTVELILRIITPSEVDNGGLLIFLDDNCQIPKIQLKNKDSIDNLIDNKIRDFFYENDVYSLLTTKQVASIENTEDVVNIYYNMLSTSTSSKIGSFVMFNERNIELLRMVNNKTI